MERRTTLTYIVGKFIEEFSVIEEARRVTYNPILAMALVLEEELCSPNDFFLPGV